MYSKKPHPGGRILVQASAWAVEFDLVVVAAGGKHGELAKVVGEPMRLFRQMDEAVLDRRRLRVQAHDLVAVGLVARDAREARLDQVLDELRP